MIAPFSQHPTAAASPAHRLQCQPGCPLVQDGLLMWDQGPGSTAQPSPCLRMWFQIAGKAQLPHLWSCVDRSWQGPWTSLLAGTPQCCCLALSWPQHGRSRSPPVSMQFLHPLLPHLPSPFPKPASFKPCSVWSTASMTASQFPGRKASGLESCRASYEVMAKVFSGLWVYGKEENTQAGFVGLFPSLLLREGPCYGELLWSPLCFQPHYCTIKRGGGSQE